MAHRVFADAGGVEWTVWNVYPSWAERRAVGSAPPPEVSGERRRFDAAEPIRRADHDLARGWLAFESVLGRRRLVPIPEGWDNLPDDDLAQFLAQAREVKPATRRLTPQPGRKQP
ncbi:MAG: hypothetical protein NVS4B3_04000 [Gemmatimonadaceae bacterium]